MHDGAAGVSGGNPVPFDQRDTGAFLFEPEFEELRHTSGISTRTNKKNQGPLLPDCHKT
jgi:hypothetical protein